MLTFFLEIFSTVLALFITTAKHLGKRFEKPESYYDERSSIIGIEEALTRIKSLKGLISYYIFF